MLEDRTLPATYVLVPLPFLPTNSANNSFVVGGSSSGGDRGEHSLPGGRLLPRLGMNVGNAGNGSGDGSGGSGFSTGGGIRGRRLCRQLRRRGVRLRPLRGERRRGRWRRRGRGDEHGGAGAGGFGNFGGYGASISSGYSFALNGANNYGMSATTLGSVPVHTYGGGGDPTENATPENGSPPATNPNGGDPPPTR